MIDPRINLHSILESQYVLLKALRDGRLTAYDGPSGNPVPATYWTDKTAASLARGDFRFIPEEVMRVFPAPPKGEEP